MILIQKSRRKKIQDEIITNDKFITPIKDKLELQIYKHYFQQENSACQNCNLRRWPIKTTEKIILVWNLSKISNNIKKVKSSLASKRNKSTFPEFDFQSHLIKNMCFRGKTHQVHFTRQVLLSLLVARVEFPLSCKKCAAKCIFNNSQKTELTPIIKSVATRRAFSPQKG